MLTNLNKVLSQPFLINILVALITGIAASALFLLTISRFKPKIKISDRIACTYRKKEGQNKQLYSFKLINKSWFYKAYDIQVKAFICETIPSQNGDDIAFEEIELRKTYQWVLPKLCWKHIWQNVFLKDSRLNSRTNYAAQFSTYANLKTCLSQKKYITFEIIAKHSLTGFSVVKSRSYKHINEIHPGNFLSGNTFKVEQVISVDELVETK